MQNGQALQAQLQTRHCITAAIAALFTVLSSFPLLSKHHYQPFHQTQTLVDMFFVSLHRPTQKQEQEVCEKGQRLGFNFKCAGSSKDAPPLPAAAQEDGWWKVDHERVKVGYGRKTYAFTKDLLLSWGQFQLRWAQVDPRTPTKPGSAVCVCANVFGLWTAVPLQVVYKQEGSWKETKQQQQGAQQPQRQASQHSQQQQKQRRKQKQRHGKQLTYAHACLQTHFLAGEERFKVQWDHTDDSVWYEIYTFSRPDHPLALLGYPVVRMLQQRFRRDSLRTVARAAACQVVDESLDDETRRRLEDPDFDIGLGLNRNRGPWWWPFKPTPLLC